MTLPGTESVTAQPVPSVCLSYGLGLDSTAVLLRWLTDPTSRDFDLTDLVVITAMTGDEFESTHSAVETVVLPRLRAAGVRFVQVARARRNTTIAGNGVVVLDDSTAPTRLYSQGAYRLSDELFAAGTLPQLGGTRKCALRAKAACLDPVIARLTAGRPFRHVIGYEAGETLRAAKDTGYNTALRTGEYPLIEWGWHRADAARFIRDLTGAEWLKSCCAYCPFAMSNAAGRVSILQRYRAEPDAGARALLLEHVARCLNPRQTLIKGSSAYDMITDAGLTDVTDRFHVLVADARHHVYEVRRITRPHASRPGVTANTARAVRACATGSRAQMRARLRRMPGTPRVGADGITRYQLAEPGPDLPRLEHFYVSAPAVVEDKQLPAFDQWWHHATTNDVLF